MKAQDQVGVTFVNMLSARGAMNSIVNLTFVTYNFTPNEQDNTVDMDGVVSCRLRMDLACAMQLYEGLGDLLKSLEKPKPGIASVEPDDEDGEEPKRRAVKAH